MPQASNTQVSQTCKTRRNIFFFPKSKFLPSLWSNAHFLLFLAREPPKKEEKGHHGDTANFFVFGQRRRKTRLNSSILGLFFPKHILDKTAESRFLLSSPNLPPESGSGCDAFKSLPKKCCPRHGPPQKGGKSGRGIALISGIPPPPPPLSVFVCWQQQQQEVNH